VAQGPRRPGTARPADNLAAVSAGSAPARPSVDVVVPFAGTPAQLAAVCARLQALRLGPDDTIVVVDNTPRRPQLDGTAVPVIHAAGRRTPAFARNRGAARGCAEWLVFLDSDATPAPDLLDLYFDPAPAPRTGLLGGGVADEEVPAHAPPAARYAYLRNVMSQERTFGSREWGYPKSANVACRRAAFDAVGGFREEIRAAEDADLTYRLRAAGWEVERRERAIAVHHGRRTLRGLIAQQLVWGAGGAWLERAYPGSVALISGPRAVRWGLAGTARGLSRIRRGNRDAFTYALLRPVEALAWELGRLRSNVRPRRGP
jgi:GT2 family glycosyltransferase